MRNKGVGLNQTGEMFFFHDEAKFNLFGVDRNVTVRRKKKSFWERCVLVTLKLINCVGVVTKFGGGS